LTGPGRAANIRLAPRLGILPGNADVAEQRMWHAGSNGPASDRSDMPDGSHSRLANARGLQAAVPDGLQSFPGSLEGRNRMSITVKSILDQKGRDVFTTSPQATLGEAARLLHERKIGAVVVVGVEGKIAGILSERDIVSALGRHGADCLGQPVSTVMTTNVYRCGEEVTVNQLMEVMTSRRFRHAPVEKDGKLAGMISIGDVVKSRIREIEQEAEDIKAYIAG
jgi:CBS domain-containing protein